MPGVTEATPGATPGRRAEGRTTVTSNLTRDEAAERARLLRVESYQVELDLTGGESTFGSQTTVGFACHRPGEATFIDLTPPEVTEVTLNGRPLPATPLPPTRITLTAP